MSKIKIKTMNKKLLFIISNCIVSNLFTQNISNMGKDFWVGYGHHQYMEPTSCTSGAAGPNDMNMRIYLSNTEATTATVKLTLHGSGVIPTLWYTKNYTIPPFTVIETENMPKGTVNAAASGSNAAYDARLWSEPLPQGTGGEGIYTKKGIHIESTNGVPIVAYAHIYGGVSSGATMLLPTDTWGYSYASINSEQGGGVTGCFSWMYVIAKDDNTVVEITPSQITRLGKPAGVPFQVTLNKGEIYQLVGQADCATGTGVQLTGTKVVSIANGSNSPKPIAVFSGSSRTGGEAGFCGSSGRDNDIQQNSPTTAWGKKYLTAPWSKSSGGTLQPTQFQNNVFKILVKDPTTVVRRNGNILGGLIGGAYYAYTSSTADNIEADKPIMVAQFMSNGSACNTGDGDPDMVYLTPLEQTINKVGFYRTNLQAINSNYITLVVPTNGLSSLKIDSSSVFNHTYNHPNKTGYSVVVKGWAAAKAQCLVTCDSNFSAITYGMGGAESYCFNAGAYVNNLENTTLPVELVDFNAQKNKDDVILNWITKNQINVETYQIERSLDGSNFVNIGSIFINPFGTTNYQYKDVFAVTKFATQNYLYYRLKTTDKDGSVAFSKTISIQLKGKSNSHATVYPNPFKDELNVQLNTTKTGVALITLKDLSGKNILSKNEVVSANNSIIKLLGLKGLKSGLYMLTIEINGEQQNIKVIK